MPLAEPVLRHLTAADAEACALLAKRVQWSHDAAAWEGHIRRGGSGAVCLTVGDQIVTTAVALRYSQRLAWIGVVITDPDYQGHGFARKLMTIVMDDLASSGVQSVMLDASEKGYPIYQKLGFRTLFPINVWTGTGTSPQNLSNAYPLTENDLADVVALDAEWMGVPRPSVIREFWQPDRAWTDRENGHVSGYLLAQSEARGVHIGPWYHHSRDGAHDLLRAALLAFNGQPLRVQIPEPNTAASALIEQHSLTINRSATRMVYGAEPPGNMSEQYAIAGFATG